MHDERLLRLLEAEFLHTEGSEKIMTVAELFDDLRKFIFDKSLKNKSLTIAERMTQKNYVDALIIDVGRIYEKTEKGIFGKMPMICDYAHHNLEDKHSIDEQNLTMYFSGMKRLSEVGSAKRAELIKVKKIILVAKNTGDEATKNHYEDMLIRLNKALGEK